MVLPLLLLAASATHAADLLPPPGSYGFDWLDANSRCFQLTAKDRARIRTCTTSHDAFGLELEAKVCRIDARHELMVYATAAQCRLAWETMQANGP
jgi:hypothetical protein